MTRKVIQIRFFFGVRVGPESRMRFGERFLNYRTHTTPRIKLVSVVFVQNEGVKELAFEVVGFVFESRSVHPDHGVMVAAAQEVGKRCAEGAVGFKGGHRLRR